MSTQVKPTFFELLRQSLQDVEGGYDLLASKFDATPYITPEVILRPFFKQLQEEKGAFEAGIDVCCGTGAASVHLSKLCSKQFTALDLSQGMLDQCKRKLQEQAAEVDLNFIKANALDMPFKEQFDVAVSFGAFGHIPVEEEDNFIRQVHKILKPGGHFFFITSGPLPWWSRSLWRQRIFNFVIGIRNLIIRPKFIMYYLTFRLPKVKEQLEANGFEVKVLELDFKDEKEFLSDLMTVKYYKMVSARKLG